MLEKPDLPDEKITTCLRDQYGLSGVRIAFLPLGADRNTAVYRVVATDDRSYFVKLRRDDFDEIAVALPKFLRDQGIRQIIAPVETLTGRLWNSVAAFVLILYPFVEGQDGYQVNLSDDNWVELGTALKRIHTVVLPSALARCIPQEAYSPRWREILKTILGCVADGAFADPTAAELVAFLQAQRDQLLDLVWRAERFASTLKAQSLELVLCHSDIHAGNILMEATGALYVVDWDNPILAPKERDLMFVGGGQFCNSRTAQEEETLFYRGYGPTPIDPGALAYYRYERIIQDIAVECEQILLTEEGGQDRAQALRFLESNFLPNNTIEIAYRSDKTHRDG
jgi:spectinomycin phosphotransferase